MLEEREDKEPSDSLAVIFAFVWPLMAAGGFAFDCLATFCRSAQNDNDAPTSACGILHVDIGELMPRLSRGDLTFHLAFIRCVVVDE